MSLPEIPITRRESYYAVMAGQYDTSVLPEHPITREEEYLNAIAHGGGGGGSTVEVTQIKSTGEKIATITVDNVPTDIYASAGGSGGGAVDTVNGKTGDVVLTASDVGALPDSTSIPTATSDLENDSNFVSDASYVHTDNNYDATAKNIVNSVTTNLAGKVDKEAGKGLSTNDYTTAEKTALAQATGDITDIKAVIPATATAQNKLVTASEIGGSDISDTATSTEINLTDSTDARVQELIISGGSAGIGAGGLTVTTCNKNRLAFDSILASDTINGVTFEPQEDGGIYVHGTSSAQTTYVFADDRKNAYATAAMPEFDGCVLSVAGIPADKQSAVNVQLGERVSPWTMIARSSGTDANIEYTASTESNGKYVFVFVDNGVNIDAVIYPMIRPSETSAAYVKHEQTTLALTTGLPLRAVGDVKDVADLAAGTVTTRIDDDGQTVLSTPVITSLSASELAAWRQLRTFDGISRITATDNPSMTVGYLLNTDNGKALATAQDDADKQITGKVDKVTGKGLSTEDYTTAEKTKLGGVETGATANTVINTTVTLLAASWTGASAPYTQTVNVTGLLATDKPILDVIISSTVATGVDEVDAWACITKADTGAGTITFSCYEDKPTIDLNVSVKVVRGAGGLTTTNIKSYTYTGTGSTSQSITFPDKPFMVLGASKEDVDDYTLSIAPFLWDANSTLLLYWQRKSGAAASGSMMSYSLTFSGNSVSWTGTDAGQALNVSGAAYTIYYI